MERGLGRDRHSSFCWNAVADGPATFKRQEPRCWRTSAWLETGIAIKGLLFENSFFEVKKEPFKGSCTIWHWNPRVLGIGDPVMQLWSATILHEWQTSFALPLSLSSTRKGANLSPLLLWLWRSISDGAEGDEGVATVPIGRRRDVANGEEWKPPSLSKGLASPNSRQSLWYTLSIGEPGTIPLVSLAHRWVQTRPKATWQTEIVHMEDWKLEELQWAASWELGFLFGAFRWKCPNSPGGLVTPTAVPYPLCYLGWASSAGAVTHGKRSTEEQINIAVSCGAILHKWSRTCQGSCSLLIL